MTWVCSLCDSALFAELALAKYSDCCPVAEVCVCKVCDVSCDSESEGNVSEANDDDTPCISLILDAAACILEDGIWTSEADEEPS